MDKEVKFENLFFNDFFYSSNKKSVKKTSPGTKNRIFYQILFFFLGCLFFFDRTLALILIKTIQKEKEILHYLEKRA